MLTFNPLRSFSIIQMYKLLLYEVFLEIGITKQIQGRVWLINKLEVILAVSVIVLLYLL